MEDIIYDELDDIITINIKETDVIKLKRKLYKKNNFIKKLLNYIDKENINKELLEDDIKHLENDIKQLEQINIKLLNIIKDNNEFKK